MKIRRLTWRAWRIPFRRTFVTSAGAQQPREGLIVRLESDSGLHGLGEIAPLRAATHAVARLLDGLQPRLIGIEVDDIASATSSLDAAEGIAAAIRCGLDIAVCDLQAKTAGVPVVELLGGCCRAMVPVNATISASSPDQAAQSARRAVEDGFRCIKLKVGMMDSVGAECELVRAVRHATGSGVFIRLDANQAWTPKTAIEALRAFEPFEIEFVEQPVAASDIEGLATVRRAVEIPIAADEAVTSLNAAHSIIEADAADLLVIKPMVVGGLRSAAAIVKHAVRAGIEVAVTTTIDSGVGVAAALHLAASLQGKYACGLATAQLLESDLTCNMPRVVSGAMACPDAPGLGVAIDEVKAAPYLERP